MKEDIMKKQETMGAEIRKKIPEKKELTHKDVAEFFLVLANEIGEPITNLKLQKLVYYAQAWYLANFNEPLFKTDFEAWVHGPVIPSLYSLYKEKGASPIVTKTKIEQIGKKIGSDRIHFLREVARVYMPRTAYELELMTHQEKPWKDARKNCAPDEECRNIISKESMKEYYGEKIQNKTARGKTKE